MVLPDVVLPDVVLPLQVRAIRRFFPRCPEKELAGIGGA